MHVKRQRSHRFIAVFLGIVAFALTGFAQADPPVRVARMGHVDGPVSFSPAGEDDWVQARLNRPLVTGDRLWADEGARAELQIGNAAIRLGSSTSVALLNLDDRVAQFELAQGTLNVRVRRLDPDQVVEIDTPNLAFVIRRPGQYRISVDPDGDATEVLTRTGRAEVYGDGASYVVDAGRAYRFFGAGLRDYEYLALPRIDEFDRWAQDRDRSYDNSISARYVSRDVIGYQDLDAYGTWRAMPQYGNVWMPTQVSPDWAPYRDGHWAWIDPWGWTWVDDAPWGFAVSHYGRWANIGGSWGWIPGPIAARAVYAPALVVFIGGANFQISIQSGSIGAVGWFPLGPRDVYRPAYPVSRTYFTNVNVSNTVINNTYVTNAYETRNVTNVTNVTYVNQQVPGAVVTVPTTAFVQSQPVARAALRVPHDAVARAPVNTVAEVVPIPASVRGAAPQGAKPPPQVLERRVVARNVPPAAPLGFAARERVLANHPGRPIDPAALPAPRPAAPVPAPKIEVVAPTRTAPPVAAPPPKAAEAASTRGKGEQQRAQPRTSAPAAQPAPPTPPAAQPASPTPPLQRGPASRPDAPGSQAPAASPQVQRAPAAQPRARRDAPATATPIPGAPDSPAPASSAPASSVPAPAPVARPPQSGGAAGASPSESPPNRGQRGNEPRSAADRQAADKRAADKRATDKRATDMENVGPERLEEELRRK